MKHAPARLTAATRLAAATRIAAATLLAALLAACGSNSPQLPPGPPSDPAGISVRPLPNESFEGSVYWELNASELLEGEPVARYLWRFGDLEVESWTDTVYRGYGREGTYEVGLTATLESGGTVEGEATVAVDDLPYDYWGEPSLLVNATGSGEKLALPFLVHFDVSDDGRFVAFTTEAAALPSDTNGASDVYVKDLESGELFLVSADGGGATVGQGPVAISSDGAFVAYRYGEVVAVVEMASGASRLIDDPDGYATVEPLAFSSDGLRLLLNARTLNDPVRTGYVVHLLPTPTFTRLGGVGGGAFVNVNAVDLSSHGNVAVFRSQHAFVPEDDNGLYDVYAYDVTADEVRLVSADSTGVVGNRLSEAHGPVVSADGRYVTFFSASSNFPRAGENGAALPVDYVYVKDLQTGALTPLSANALEHAADSDSILPTLAIDARYAAFGSYATNLSPLFDHPDECLFGSCPNGFTYVKDLTSGRVAMVGVGVDHTPPNDWDQIEPRITGNGQWVVFYSQASNLGSGAPTGDWDLYRAPNPLWVAIPDT